MNVKKYMQINEKRPVEHWDKNKRTDDQNKFRALTFIYKDSQRNIGENSRMKWLEERKRQHNKKMKLMWLRKKDPTKQA